MDTPFHSRIIKRTNRTALVYLVTALARGKPAWYYLQVDEPKQKAFEKQLALGTLDLADYGTILHSGWGHQPPYAIRALVEESYSDAA
jgi:hypothetical protein